MRFAFWIILPLAVGAISVSACKTVARRGHELKQIGGTPLDVNNPGNWSAVGLATESKWIFCTGTLVGDGLVATAAHCVNRQPYYVAFESVASPERVYLRVTDMLSHPDFFGDFNFDVGWVKFDGTAPEPFRPIKIVPSLADLNCDQEVLLVGFGQTSQEVNDAGSHKLSLATRFYKAIDNRFVRAAVLVHADVGTGACYGDSGGPAYARVGEEWYVIGATQGPGKQLEWEFDIPLNGRCDDGGLIYAALTPFIPWIMQTSGAAVAGADPQATPRQEWSESGSIPNDFLGWCKDAQLTRGAFRALASFLFAQKSLDCETALERYRDDPALDLTVAGGSDYDLRPLLLLPPPRRLTLSGDYQLESFRAFFDRTRELKLNNFGGSLDAVAEFEALESLAVTGQMSLGGTPDAFLAEPVMPAPTLGTTDAGDFSWARELPLRSLELFRVSAASLSGLRPHAGKLTRLVLDETGTTDFGILPMMAALKFLKIKGNPAASLAAAVSAPAIEEIDLSANGLRSLGTVENRKLKSLDLSENQLTSVAALASFPVQRLNLAKNQISDASSFSTNHDIVVLRLTDNPLSTNTCPLPQGGGSCAFE